MLTRVEALNFRCLRYVSQPLDPFHVLVGPNASGKTTFFDVVGFVSRLLKEGLEEAIEAVSSDPLDLLFGKSGDRFEIALEAAIPTELQSGFPLIRYELAVSVPPDNKARIESEKILFVSESAANESTMACIPEHLSDMSCSGRFKNLKEIFSIDRKTSVAHVSSESDTSKAFTGPWPSPTDFWGERSLFSAVHDGMRASTWFSKMLTNGVQNLDFNSLKLRSPSPPRKGNSFKADGSNLPWVVHKLEGLDAYQDWIDHLQTALPDLVGVRTIEREEDRYRYLKIKYANGLEIPSWMTSDGTLRLLALTLPAFIKDMEGIFLVEEPENGLHPKALETVFQALSYIPNTQVLVTTHSPQLLALAELTQILCFAKDSSGAVDIVSGDQHPSLRDWQRDISLGSLFAAGALE